jgi:hypothetical protein
MNKTLKTSKNSLHKRQSEDKQLLLKYIKSRIEKGTGLSISELIEQHSEEQLFRIALYHITTTKKAICTALNIPIEAGCRYKRTLEKEGKLIQSVNKIHCPFTDYLAHLLSTNPKEFERLLKSNTNQLNLFE